MDNRYGKLGFWTGLAWAGLLLSGCGEDCTEAMRLGDFELSQGNVENAVKQYERAMTMPGDCGRAKEKLEAARKRLQPPPGGAPAQ